VPRTDEVAGDLTRAEWCDRLNAIPSKVVNDPISRTHVDEPLGSLVGAPMGRPTVLIDRDDQSVGRSSLQHLKLKFQRIHKAAHRAPKATPPVDPDNNRVAHRSLNRRNAAERSVTLNQRVRLPHPKPESHEHCGRGALGNQESEGARCGSRWIHLLVTCGQDVTRGCVRRTQGSDLKRPGIGRGSPSLKNEAAKSLRNFHSVNFACVAWPFGERVVPSC
jgi:hypothetical protein